MPKEYLIARYIYLTEQLSALPPVSYGRNRGQPVIEIISNDASGNRKRRRITAVNHDWKEFAVIADLRRSLNNELTEVINIWSKNNLPSIESESEKYIIRSNTGNPLTSSLWESLNNNECNIVNDYPVSHNGIIMRSQFEVQVAEALEEMHIAYKYEPRLVLDYQGMPEFPDFALNFPEFNRCGFAEVMGALTSIKYVSRNTMKIENYINHGIYPNRDLAIIPGDNAYRSEPQTIKRIISVIIDAITRQHLFLKE